MPKLLILSEEEFEMVQQLAGLCFTPEEIALVVEKDYNEVKFNLQNKNSDFYKAYQKGTLLYMIDVRKSIYDLAKGGSSASQAEYLKLRQKADTAIHKLSL